MGGIALFPNKAVVIAKSSQNVTITRQVVLYSDKWLESNNLYCYTIKDENVTTDMVVFMRSYKEYGDVISSCGIMMSYPEVSKGEIRIYASKIPSTSITCDYVCCNGSIMVGTDQAEALSYHDTHNIGVTNVQDALDLLLSRMVNK